MGRALYRRCEQVKRAWDPGNLLNPGRIVGGADPRGLFALAAAASSRRPARRA